MTPHRALIELYVKLGYSKDNEGCCRGASVRWIEACLLNEEAHYHARIKKITGMGGKMATPIKQALAKKGTNLSKKDREHLEILSFFDSLSLYQTPGLHKNFFDEQDPLTQQNLQEISKIASSDAINTLGGLVTVYSQPLIYNEQEIIKYLEGLGLAIEQHTTVPNQVFGIILSNTIHAISLTYTTGLGWKLMDINQYPSIAFNIKDTPNLTKKIIKGLQKPKDPYTAFNVSLITTGNYPQLSPLTDSLKEFEKQHAITQETTKRQGSMDVTYLATYFGHASLEEIAKHNVTLDNKNPAGQSVLHIAASLNHAHLVPLFKKSGFDLEMLSKDGNSALMTATFLGNAKFIDAMATHGAQLNIPTPEGYTPAAIAALMGHTQVLDVLIKHDATLLNFKNYLGQTLDVLAALNDQAQFIDALVKHNFTFKTAQSALTPAHMAARYGHVKVIDRLKAHQISLNSVDVDGFTPAVYAVQRGHSPVIDTLARHGCDLQATYTDGSNLMHIAAMHNRGEVIATLIKHKVDPNAKKKDGLTPLQVAAQACAAEAFAALIKQGANTTILDNEGLTLLQSAVQKSSTKIVVELIKAGADLNTPFTTTTDQFNKLFPNADKNRMQEFINKQQDTITVTAQNIAYLMKHERITYLLNQEKKVSLLYKSINGLKEYGQNLINTSHRKNGNKAVALADKLEKIASRFLSTDLPDNKVRIEFKKALEQGFRDMQIHRTPWKHLLINIGIAATGIGLILIFGQVLASGTLFFARTQRQKQIDEISATVTNIEKDMS